MAAEKTKRTSKKNISNVRIQKFIQAFVYKLKEEDPKVLGFKNLLIPSVIAIVLFGVTFSTAGVLAPTLTGSLLVTQLLGDIFKDLGSNILWDVLQTWRNSKRRQTAGGNIRLQRVRERQERDKSDAGIIYLSSHATGPSS